MAQAGLKLGPPPIASGTASGAGAQQVEHHGRFPTASKGSVSTLTSFFVATGWRSSDVRQGKGPPGLRARICHAVLHVVADYLGGRSISMAAIVATTGLKPSMKTTVG